MNWCEARELGFTVVQKRDSNAVGLALPQVAAFKPDGEPHGGSDPRGESGVVYAR